jgi:thiol-disulfide isomerase/thioredoxin
MNCPHCNNFVPDNNYKCPHCHKVVQEELEPTEFLHQAAKKPAVSPNVVVVIMLVLGVVVLAYLMFFKGGTKEDNPALSTSSTTSQQAARPRPAPPRTQKANQPQTKPDSGEQQGQDIEPVTIPDADSSDELAENPADMGGLKVGYVANAKKPGEEVQLEDFVQGDQTTIFDFYSRFCPPCQKISPWLKELDKRRDDLVVFKVDINRPGVRGIDWQSPVARQYNLKSIPYFIVYNSDGERIYEGQEAYDYVTGLITDEGIAN